MSKRFKLLHNEENVMPLTLSLNFTGYGSKELAKLIGIKKPLPGYFLFRNTVMWYYTDIRAWESAAKLIFSKAKKNKKDFYSIIEKSEKLKNQILKILHKIDKQYLNSLSGNDNIKLLRKLTDNAFTLSYLSELGPVADHYHNIYSKELENIITKAKIKTKNSTSLADILNLINTPTWDYPSDQAHRELKKIVKGQKKKIANYYKKWCWLDYGHLGPINTVNKINTNLNKKIIFKIHNKTLQKQKQIFNDLKLTKQQKNLCEIAKIFVYLRGMRAEICNGIFYIIHLMTNKISKESGYKKELLHYCSITEIIEYFNTNKLPAKKNLQSRARYSIWHGMNPYQINILDGNKTKSFIKTKIEINKKNLKNLKNIKKIKGQIAFPGIIKGKVCIINTRKDIMKIKSGNILVSIQTSPEILPAMKKSAALITNIGGITSHAAIVARELKKPCLIGTKVATEVFKDGDLVEVNATKGYIKKL